MSVDLRTDSGRVIFTGRVGCCPLQGFVIDNTVDQPDRNIIKFRDGSGLHAREIGIMAPRSF